jgi:lupus La protein
LSGQVEYYFSDGTLKHDSFMMEAMNGNENRPVPVETILTFPKMRRYKPKTAVMKVLKELSTTLISQTISSSAGLLIAGPSLERTRIRFAR